MPRNGYFSNTQIFRETYTSNTYTKMPDVKNKQKSLQCVPL